MKPTAARTVVDFDDAWLFSRGDVPTAPLMDFDDTALRTVQLPHDWSVEGPFAPEHARGTGWVKPNI